MNTQKTTEFCKKYPNFESCTIQLFSDTKKGGGEIIPIEKGRLKRCEEANKQGKGVFFSVNSMVYGKRTKNDTTRINAWIVECDELSKEAQLEACRDAPLPPSIIIESKKSYHIYYLAQDGDKETYSTICGGLRDYYKGDPVLVTDRSRVLRLPGFEHKKDPNDPFLVDCVYMSPEITYTKQQMIKAFPREEQEAPKQTTKPKSGDDFREEITRWNTEEMLMEVSGTGLVDGEHVSFKNNAGGTKQIRVNDKPTGCWIDKQGFIGSKDGGGPTRVQWVMYYRNVTKSELYKFVMDKRSDRLPKSVKNQQKQKKKVESTERRQDTYDLYKHISYGEKLRRAVSELRSTKPDEVIKWGWQKFDAQLGGIYPGKIYLIGAESGHGKSTFVNAVCDNVWKQGRRVAKYSLEDRMEEKGKEDLFFAINRLRKQSGLTPYKRTHFNNNEYGSKTSEHYDDMREDLIETVVSEMSKCNIIELEKKDQVTIDTLEELIIEEIQRGTRFFCVDHLHYFKMMETQRRDLEIQDVMHRLNDLVRTYGVTIFLIAHYNNKASQSSSHPTLDMFKDGSAIKQVVDIAIQIVSDRYTGETMFYFTKLRGPVKVDYIECTFNVDTFMYDFAKTKKQEKHDKNPTVLGLLQ